MKNMFLILIFFSLIGCAWIDIESSNNQEFVNTIFSKPLLAYGRTSWNTILTPNSITESPDDFSSPDAYIEKHDCKLLENQHNYIKYFCNVCHPDILNRNKIMCSHEVIVYQVNDRGLIEKQSFELDEQEPYSLEYLTIKR